MTYSVYNSDCDLTAKAGFGRVAHLPCIFDSRPGYHRLASQYLIDRGLGHWTPGTKDRLRRGPPPTSQSMHDYACWLANFLEWAECRCIDIHTCDYQDEVYGRYQKEMLNGIWSRDAQGLSPSTVNVRVQQACDFLQWMCDKGHRGQFDVPYEVRRYRVNSSNGGGWGQIKDVAIRKGRVRQAEQRLRIPSDSELTKWLDGVYRKFGQTKGLMCETVLLSAVRREEAACLRVDTLPEDPRDWHIGNTNAFQTQQRVLIPIKFGAKGPCYGYDHGDKVGPERSVWIPLNLAERLHEYRMRSRISALKRWVKAARTLEEQKMRINNSVHLFINEPNGVRIGAKDLYNAWTGVELPYKGWSPHLGRHWWACSVLWNEMKKHEHLVTQGVDVAAALIESTAMGIIRLQIQPQLGHASDRTTLIYLRWLFDMLGYSPAIRYEAALDDKGCV